MNSYATLRLALLVALLALPIGTSWAGQLDRQLDAIEGFTFNQPERALAELRRLEPQLDNAALDTRAAFLELRGRALHNVGKRDASMADVASMLGLAQQSGNRFIEARALLLKGDLFVNSDTAQANRLVWQALRLSAGGPPVLQVRAKIDAGKAYRRDGQFDKAVTSLMQASEMAQQHELHSLAVTALHGAAMVYYSARQYDKGLSVIDEAAALATRHHFDSKLADLRILEYGMAKMAGQLKRAKRALESGLAWARHHNQYDQAALAATNLADFYLTSKDGQRAFQYADEAVKLRERSGQRPYHAYLINRGLALLMLGRREEAGRDFDNAFKALSGIGDKPELMYTLDEYARALEQTGDYRGTVAALRRSRALAEELFNEQRTKALLKLQQEYDASKREAKIELLRRDNEAHLAELAHGRRQRLFLGLLGAVSVAASVLLAALYHKLRRANGMLHKSNERLTKLSQHDPLTSLFNRRHFQQFMASLPDGTRRAPDATGEECTHAMYLLDIDHFKHINDTYGHAAGDSVLKTVAQRLREIVRETDMIVRWGGEEFLVFAPTPASKLAEVAQRILGGIAAQPVEFNGKQITVHVSLGYSRMPLADGEQLTWERTLALADHALYLAKNRGRNRGYGLRRIADTKPATLQRAEESLDRASQEGLVDLELVLAT